MPLTSNCSIFGSFHEKGFNKIISHVMKQRPSLFNYATADLGEKGNSKLCHKISAHPGVDEFNNEYTTEVSYLPILGYSGIYGLSFCAQIIDMKIDFHPGNIINLPAELNPPLKPQRVALSLEFCAGIACPDPDIIREVVGSEGREEDDKNFPSRPLRFEALQCFCLKVCAIAVVRRNATHIWLELEGLEIKDIRPVGLENSMECYLSTMLNLSIFPKLKIALNDLVFDLESYVSIAPTPISPAVPFNPSIKKDTISIFLNAS